MREYLLDHCILQMFFMFMLSIKFWIIVESSIAHNGTSTAKLAILEKNLSTRYGNFTQKKYTRVNEITVPQHAYEIRGIALFMRLNNWTWLE